MKLLLLLTLSTFLVAVGATSIKFGKSPEFRTAVRESLAIQHAVWLRNHHAAKEGAPMAPGFQFVGHHNIPEHNLNSLPVGQAVAVNQFGITCDPGYTGELCNIPMCDTPANITTHNVMSMGEAIELATSYECTDTVTFPVDNYALDIVITIYAAEGGQPTATLTSPFGKQVEPDDVENPDDDYKNFQAHYYAIVEAYGAGYYTLQLQSLTTGPCSYQITSMTRAVYDAGFVQSVQDDNVAQEIFQAWHVLREPVQNTANYLGAKLSGAMSPASPQVVTFYNGDDKQYAPMTIGVRYQCNAPYVTPMYTCVRPDFYKAKFVGYDHKGSVFQRLYTFTCQQTNPSFPPPSPSPTPVPDDCLNGGTMITYGVNNRTCICGAYYTGNQCEIKQCFNGGVLIDGVCMCAPGYSGTHCTDVLCKNHAGENFDTSRRALVFVVRTSDSFAPYINTSVFTTAQYIVNWNVVNNPGYFRRYVLVGYANNALTYNNEFDDSVNFLDAIKALPISPGPSNCTDSLYGALGAAITSDSIRMYQRSPVFSFGDNLPSDPENRASLYESLGYYSGQIFTILTDASQSSCPIDVHDPEYRQLRRLAQFTLGLVPSLPVGNLTDPAFNLVTGVERKVSLATNDFVDQCSLGSKYTTFFIDDATGAFTILATGDSLNIQVMRTDGQMITPDKYIYYGNTHIYSFTKNLIKGNYLLEITADQNSPCQFRVLGDSSYELFAGVSNGLTTDLSHHQPMPFEQTNIVARINNVFFRNPSEVFSEVVVWTNDRLTGQRHVLYAGNGVYRDGCDYDFVFENFMCAERDLLFYISVYVTDRVGYTVQRVRPGVCAAPMTVPTSPEGCQNGGVVDPTNRNSSCICPNGWMGDKCQIINCQNGGVSRFSYCECRAGFAGEFCELPACTRQTFEDFGPNRRSLTFLVHDSISTIQMIQKMQTQMAQIIQDITQQHPLWINQYNLLTFDDQTAFHLAETDDPAVFLQKFNTFAATNAYNTTKRSCDNLLVLESLYIHISTSSAEKYGLYYVFMNGIMGLSPQIFDSTSVLLETTQSQVNIIQTNAYPCGQPITAEGPARMWALSSMTGGQTYVISSATIEKVMRTIPFQYRNSLTYEHYYDDCSGVNGKTFYFPVDSETQTVSILIDGQLSSDPTYVHPDGTNDAGMVINLFNDYAASTRLDQIIGQCDNNWRKVEGRCWRFFATTATWDEAKAACKKEKGVLATIFDKGIEDYLYSNSGAITFWIGLNDIDSQDAWVWDQGDGSALPLSQTNYLNWGANQPNSGAGRCVQDHKDNKWQVNDCNAQLPFACVKHIYDADYSPDQVSTNKIDPGYWSVNVKTYQGACAVQLAAQSAIQVYPAYGRTSHDDFGASSPLTGNVSNYIIAHANGIASFGEKAGTLDYAHMYASTKDQSMLQVEKLWPRDPNTCKHQFVSDAFTCAGIVYQTMYTGVDRYGYTFQRITPTLCYNEANASCANGGVFSDNGCICPPNYGGELCTLPYCQNGFLSANLQSCNCEGGLYEGDFCEIPRCINGTSNLQPDTNQNKTLVLVIDGSYSLGMEAVLNNLQSILTNVIVNATNVQNGWFTHFVGIVAFDSTNTGNPISQRIDETNVNSFITNLVSAATTPKFNSSSNSRALFTAISNVLVSPNINHRSHMYVISAANAEDGQLLNPVLDLIAYTHTAVNFMFIGDQAAPGNTTYIDDKVDALHELAVLTGGGFYQVHDATQLVSFWFTQLTTVFNSFNIIYESHHNCSVHTSYIQVGANTNKLLFDIFSMVSVSLQIVDSNGNQITVDNPTKTATNYLFSVNAQSGNTFAAGVYTITVTSLNLNSHPFCTVSVKGISSLGTYIAYTQDTGMDNGQHSNNANYYPQVAPERNAVVVSAQFGKLEFAQAYGNTGRIVWASQMIARTNCNYNYISRDVFTCPDASYGLAIEGTDDDGHPWRRFEIVHCVGKQHTVTLTEQPHSFATLTHPKPEVLIA